MLPTTNWLEVYNKSNQAMTNVCIKKALIMRIATATSV